MPSVDNVDDRHGDTAAVLPLRSSPSTYFLEQLQNIRHGDSVSGSVWKRSPGLTGAQAAALGHIDRATEGLNTVLALLQASSDCKRRRPEDFGIGDDRHEGLLFAARELGQGLRDRLDALEARWLRDR